MADASPQHDPGNRPGGGDELRVTCAFCGTGGFGPPLTWSFESDPRRGVVYYCQACSRENLRAIESKLNSEWW